MATALPALSPARRLWLMAEMALLYLAAPLGVYVLVYGYGTPLFMVLLPVFVIFATILTIDGDFIWRKLLTTGIKWAELAQILALFLVAGAAIAWFAWKTAPGLFLHFPRRLPELWLIVHGALSANFGDHPGNHVPGLFLSPLWWAFRPSGGFADLGERRAFHLRPHHFSELDFDLDQFARWAVVRLALPPHTIVLGRHLRTCALR